MEMQSFARILLREHSWKQDTSLVWWTQLRKIYIPNGNRVARKWILSYSGTQIDRKLGVLRTFWYSSTMISRLVTSKLRRRLLVVWKRPSRASAFLWNWKKLNISEQHRCPQKFSWLSKDIPTSWPPCPHNRNGSNVTFSKRRIISSAPCLWKSPHL